MLTISEKPSSINNKCKSTANEPAMVAALQKLTKEMVAGRLKSGQALKESVLAKKYGLSRNAIREALNQIVGWGLFEYIPYRGYRIKKFTIYNLLQWDQLREAIEPIAARCLAKKCPQKISKKLKKYCEDMEEAYLNMDRVAFGKADYLFHLCVVEHCGNDYFSQLQTISNLSASFYFGKSILEVNQEVNQEAHNFSEFRYDLEHFNKEDDSARLFAATMDAHRKMSEAIFSGDAEGAEEMFRHHARCQVKIVERYITMITKFK